MQKEILALGNGSVMRCIMTQSSAFERGKDYVTNTAIFCGLPDIEIDRYSVNYHRNGYFGIEGCSMYAKFIMIKDSKGRYVKRSRYMDMSASRNNGKDPDLRRMRRYVRQMLKNDSPRSYEYKVLNRLARSLGK